MGALGRMEGLTAPKEELPANGLPSSTLSFQSGPLAEPQFPFPGARCVQPIGGTQEVLFLSTSSGSGLCPAGLLPGGRWVLCLRPSGAWGAEMGGKGTER